MGIEYFWNVSRCLRRVATRTRCVRDTETGGGDDVCVVWRRRPQGSRGDRRDSALRLWEPSPYLPTHRVDVMSDGGKPRPYGPRPRVYPVTTLAVAVSTRSYEGKDFSLWVGHKIC